MDAITEINFSNPFEMDNISAKAHTVLEEYGEAARDGLLESKIREMDQFLRMIELEKNRLHVSEDDYASKLYYSGQIAGIMQLCRFLCDSKKNESEFIRISNNNKLLTSCVIYIGENNVATGAQIREFLNLKHRSNLTNLIERQKPYALISKYKFHNRNVYMLTEKGRQMYYQQILVNSKHGSKEKTISDLLDTLIRAIDQESINQFSLVADLCEMDTSLEYYFTSLSFAKKISNYCTVLSDYVQKKFRKMIVGKLRIAKNGNESPEISWRMQEDDFSDSIDGYTAFRLGDSQVKKGEMI